MPGPSGPSPNTVDGNMPAAPDIATSCAKPASDHKASSSSSGAVATVMVAKTTAISADAPTAKPAKAAPRRLSGAGGSQNRRPPQVAMTAEDSDVSSEKMRVDSMSSTGELATVESASGLSAEWVPRNTLRFRKFIHRSKLRNESVQFNLVPSSQTTTAPSSFINSL